MLVNQTNVTTVLNNYLPLMSLVFVGLWITLPIFQFSLYSRCMWYFVINFVEFLSVTLRPFLFFIISIFRL